jgi:hypothetical protein
MGARNQVRIGFSYRPASLCCLATQFQTRFLESIPRPIAGHVYSVYGGVGYGVLRLRQINTCRKVPLQVNFFKMTTFCIAFYMSLIFLRPPL